MKGNKKGFTLIELLAVIVILGLILMLAVTNVIPIFRKSKYKGFTNDAITLSEAARIKYKDDLLSKIDGDIFSGSVQGIKCYSIEESLLGEYASSLNKNLKGTVEVCYANSCTYKTKIWLSNGTIHINGATDEELKKISENTIKNTTYSDNEFKNCGR